MIEQQPNFDRCLHALLGLPFDAVGIAGAVQSVRIAASSRKRCFFSTPNLNFLIACLHDAAFRDSVIHSDLSVADGMPLIWIAHLLKIPLPERVAGSSMFEILRSEVSNNIKVYFFGGMPGVAEAACRELNVTSVGVRCVGYESPGFGSIEQMSSDEIISRINASEADFLVVALGARKGNAWIEHNLSRLTVPVVSHLGAVVNFVAGAVNRAPDWMQRVGLEWLWRIKEEPQLWKRYFFDGMAFCRLLYSRVLPYAWYLRQYPPLPDEIARATVSFEIITGIAVLKLQGAWTCSNLEPMRAAFKRVVDESVNISLDMADVSHVDSAFIGLLMLLHGHQQQAGIRLKVVGVTKSVRRIFKWSCAEFLLGDAGEC